MFCALVIGAPFSQLVIFTPYIHVLPKPYTWDMSEYNKLSNFQYARCWLSYYLFSLYFKLTVPVNTKKKCTGGIVLYFNTLYDYITEQFIF